MRQFIFVFIVIAACGAWARSSSHESPSVKKHMASVEGPNFKALKAMLNAGGPKDDKEWAQALNNATLIAESRQYLLDSPKDQDVWIKTSNAMSESATAAAKAAEAKDVEAWKAAAGEIGKSCQGCHDLYRKKKK